ncbi:VCBS repeat-containing protein [Streptomyces pactum]|uniref:VCBS repeat-containing protein n=1 Tax=Streptomyces pactum TaxID=68249 RepID=A0ABS0NDR1_9ACTN|nr:VCBS repeat-containing protein [Streptomyces pactum]
MRHGVLRRRPARRAGAVFIVSAALAAGLSPQLPTASAVDGPQETVVPATLRNTVTSASLFYADTTTGSDGAGAQGVFHRLEGHRGLVWTRYVDGQTFPAPAYEGSPPTNGTGSDTLAHRLGDGRVDLWDASDGTTRTLRIPEGQQLFNITGSAVYGTTAVTYRKVTDAQGRSAFEFHLLTPGPDGTTRDVRVEDAPGMRLHRPSGADATTVLFTADSDGSGRTRVVAVDRESGQVRGWSAEMPPDYYHAKLGRDHVVVYGISKAKVLVLPRADLSVAATEVELQGGGINPAQGLAVVGDWLVHRPSSGTAVRAQPIAGGSSVTIGTANPGVSVGPADSAVFVGRTATEDWGIQRITAGADGRPVVTRVKPLPKPPAAIQGLSLEQGRLVVTDPSGGRRDDYVRTVAASGPPTFGERTAFTPTDVLIAECPAGDAGCSRLHGTADGRVVWVERDTTSSGSDRLRANGPGRGLFERAVPAGGQVTDVSGRYVLHVTASGNRVYRLDDSAAPLTRPPGAAALWGDVLWTAGSDPGSVTEYSLSTGKTTHTLTLGTGCVPEELQVVGRWLYWSCGPDAGAGVYDRVTKTSVPVPSGEARLGDGYVVTHDRRAGTLTLTTVTGGTPASRVIAELPDTGVSQRDVRWTVDDSGANAAYVDAQERVHLVPSGVPAQPLGLLGPAGNASSLDAARPGTTPRTLTTVLLSKPSASWRLTVRDKATGKVVDTTSGGAARGELTVGWHGAVRTSAGEVFFPNGKYDWTLSITPADGTGAPLEVRGTVALNGGAPVLRDHAGARSRPDGTGDLLTLSTSGELAFQHGDGKGAFSGKTASGGWPTSVVAVPFGDLNKDRCNDVLVRMADGSLRGYKPRCGERLTTTTPYTKLGTGWNAYNVLTSPGDLTGDKRPDLLARKSSNGDIHLFAANSDGTLAAGRRIHSGWTGYTKIAGAGDLNGDGFGDLLARHKDGTLYRHDGQRTGKLKDRVKVFGNWGASYNAIVGVGDLTGDGRSDLVVRDSSGNVYRHDGKGNGSFTARTKIATGWKHKALF